MTSNNTITYGIFDKEGTQVGTHTQNIMCKRCNDGLFDYTPAEDFTILYMPDYEEYDYDDYPYDYDPDGPEDEEPEQVPLNEWLLANKAEYTHRRFEPSDQITVYMKTNGKFGRVKAEVVERLKGKWVDNYTVKLEDGTILNDIQQNQVLPL